MSSIRAPFEFLDFGHICGYASSVLAFTRPIATLRLGSVVVLRHVRLLCFFSVAEMRLDRKVTGVTIPAAPTRSSESCSRNAASTSVYNHLQVFVGSHFMKKISVLVLGAVLGWAGSIPAHAGDSKIFKQHQLSPAARKASRKQAKAANKYAKKYSKQQQKAIRKQAKAQRKALKQARNRSVR